MNYSDDFREMIKKYNEELKKMQKKSKPATNIPVQSNNVVLTPEEQAEEQIANEFPFKNDYSLPNINENEMIKGQTVDLTGVGYLIVRVSVSNAAAPVAGATVLVSFDDTNGEKLIKSSVTDVNGETPKIALPTVAESESLEPGVKNPYASYSIRVSADKYFTIDSVNVPIFDKQTAIQPVEMVPLPEGFGGNTVLKSNDTGSITLN